MKKMAAIFWNDDIGYSHLYKDVGGIPYSMAKYCGWKTTLVYSDINGYLSAPAYERYVRLETFHYTRLCKRLKLRFVKYLRVMQFVWKHAGEYDVINFYHTDKLVVFLCWLAKKSNPKVTTYIKMDTGRAGVESLLADERTKRFRLRNFFIHAVDLFTIETRSFAEMLADGMPKMKRIKYLPNGFFSDFADGEEATVAKENIILTVGRLGSWSKNTELLIDALTGLGKEKLADWRVYLAGSIEPEFVDWMQEKYLEYPWLQEILVFTGMITDKAVLSRLYRRAKVFVLSSRLESWGLVVSEAMGEDDYVIVTDCCDAFHEYIDITDENGFGKILPNEDTKSFCKAMEGVLAGEVDVERRGRLAGKYAKEHLDWEVIAKDLNELLQPMIVGW